MKENLAWRQFEAGREYNRRIGLYENAASAERFYRGDQWKSLTNSQLPTPVFNIIRRINEQGKTVLLVEQNAFAALSIADYAYILEVGSVVLEGPGKDMLKNPKVREAYLGG